MSNFKQKYMGGNNGNFLSFNIDSSNLNNEVIFTPSSLTPEETDPIFSASAAAGITTGDINNWNAKSDFSGSYNDLTNKPTIPIVPSNVSAFTNDAGYLTSFTETDPTVPAWAKAASKPTYTAAEVGAIATTHAAAAITATDISNWNAKSDFSGSYNDLEDKPTIPAAQVQSDWNATTGMGVILNKPTIPTVTNTYSASSSDAMSGIAVNSAITSAISNLSSNLSGLTDTTITNPSNGQILVYDGTSSKWINTAFTAVSAETDANVNTMLNSFELDYTTNTVSPNVWTGGSY